MKLISAPISVPGVNSSVPIPLDTRSNPISVFGHITDGFASTYVVQYTTSDVFAAGYTPVGDTWTSITGSPTTGNAVFNMSGLGATAIRLHVTAGTGSVSIDTAFQAESTQGA